MTGEGRAQGPGPSQGKINNQGDAYLSKEFPSCQIVSAGAPEALVPHRKGDIDGDGAINDKDTANPRRTTRGCGRDAGARRSETSRRRLASRGAALRLVRRGHPVLRRRVVPAPTSGEELRTAAKGNYCIKFATTAV